MRGPTLNAQQEARSAVDGWERRMFNSEQRLFFIHGRTAAHAVLQRLNSAASGQALDRAPHTTTSQPLTTRVHIAHYSTQQPIGTSFWPISCSIRARGHPPGPSTPPERRPGRDEYLKKLAVSTDALPFMRAAVSNQLPRMNRWRRIRCQRRPRAPGTSAGPVVRI